MSVTTELNPNKMSRALFSHRNWLADYDPLVYYQRSPLGDKHIFYCDQEGCRHSITWTWRDILPASWIRVIFCIEKNVLQRKWCDEYFNWSLKQEGISKKIKINLRKSNNLYFISLYDLSFVVIRQLDNWTSFKICFTPFLILTPIRHFLEFSNHVVLNYLISFLPRKT